MIISATQTTRVLIDVPDASTLNKAVAQIYEDGGFTVVREEKSPLVVKKATMKEAVEGRAA